MLEEIWIFVSESAQFPCACFERFEDAELTIQKYSLSGILTAYPLGKTVFDWAVENQFFRPQKPEHFTAAFIGKFTSASQKHIHYSNGIES
jgi:hypothetical protein